MLIIGLLSSIFYIYNSILIIAENVVCDRLGVALSLDERITNGRLIRKQGQWSKIYEFMVVIGTEVVRGRALLANKLLPEVRLLLQVLLV